MIETWDDLPFWESEDYISVNKNLENCSFNPHRSNLYRAMDLTPFDKVKIVLMGQDPYPDTKYATGVAFSIPSDARCYPPTLQSILREYCTDLHYKRPANGCLERWCKEGVLLWNAFPTCEIWRSKSHDWKEWANLTAEIVKVLSERGNVVFVFTGAVAREFVSLVDTDKNCVIETSHPSPRGSMNSKTPFVGSRVFSRVNECLVQELGVDPVDWYLDEPSTKREESNVVQHRRARLETS